MHLEIITPDRKVYEGEAVSVQFPGSDGLFEVLNNHAPLIGALGQGNIRIRTASGGEQRITIDGGVVEVLNNNITVLAESAK
jgi:F-type H+-transporting ATPase subunit epsilon